MAKSKKLKVFRTPIGFHDAYVAAPSQKAALEAWGSDSNLFAAGVAEVVTDSALTRKPLERPGEVVRVLRGSADEQVAALGADRKVEGGSRIKSAMTKHKSGTTRKRRGKRPSSAAVDKSEAALRRAEARHRAALDKLKAEAQALDKKRRELERTQRGERERLSQAVDDERERYRAAMDEWAG